MMHNFRRYLYRTLNITPPAAFPHAITFLHRAGNRRILNRDEVLVMLRTFGWEVKLLETEKDKPFAEQVQGLCWVAHRHPPPPQPPLEEFIKPTVSNTHDGVVYCQIVFFHEEAFP